MKTLKKIFLICFLTSFPAITLFAQEWSSSDEGSTGVTIDFINSNTGFIGVKDGSGTNFKVLKTTNKGNSFTEIWSTAISSDNSKGFGLDMIDESIGYIYIRSILYRTSNGGANWVQKYELQYTQSESPVIKFLNDNLGYVTFTNTDLGIQTRLDVYEFTNSGSNHTRVYQSPLDQKVPVVNSIDIAPNGNFIMTGYYKDIQSGNYLKQFSLTKISGSISALFNGYNNTIYGPVKFLPNYTDYRFVGSQQNGFGDPNTGTFIYSDVSSNTRYKITPSVDKMAGLSFSDSQLGYALVGDTIFKTTNSGVNWSRVYYVGSISSFNHNALNTFGEVVYAINQTADFITHKLSTNISSYFDNQSSSGSIMFDNNSYNTPSTEYFRGGNSSLSSTSILNSGQSNERLFYKWDDNSLNPSRSIYLDVSGYNFANYYKTKQVSTTSTAISNIGQEKIVKDEGGAINQIHQSLSGGIFYTKSYNNGSSYNREEVISKFSQEPLSGNKNPSISETKWYGTPSSYPINKNVVASWERIKEDTTEIRVAVRDWYMASDTVFQWNCWNNSGSDIFVKFPSSSYYDSKPQIFALSTNLSSGLGNANEYFFIVPHLRPYSGGNKLWVSCKKGTSLSADFALDSGDISDFSVIDSNKVGGGNYLRLHFAYRKGSNIVYRKTGFEQYSTLPLAKYNLEGPTIVSSGDGGFSSRLKPTISLMNSVPVIAYSASYNVWRTIQYEDNSFSNMEVFRYPIVKVQRYSESNWGNYVIYNSGNQQNSPELEGSKNTLSYVLNYSQGNGTFKKVANVNGNGGSMCQPNLFSGTDVRLIKNSYVGDYANNLSMLTLTSENPSYKIGKQDFVITNITAYDSYDISALDGVINLDTINYSFKLVSRQFIIVGYNFFSFILAS